jgi:hypothetical protein
VPLFRHHAQADARRRVAALVAMAAHVERNTPQIFPRATTDRLEDAADELLGGGAVSFETAMVVRRILESVRARRPDRPWPHALEVDLAGVDLDDLAPGRP